MVEDSLTQVRWRKSARSGSYSNCVEVALVGHGCVGVRDSKDPSGPVLTFTQAEWAEFLRTHDTPCASQTS
jgi:hypothetical protein